MPMKPPDQGPPLFLAPLAYPDFYSLAEQDDARRAVREHIGWTEAQLDRMRRERGRSPAENVVLGTDNPAE
jgi:hypothetical protein